jgi:hypothetical protein
MVIGACPECDADVVFNEMPSLEQRIVCARCRAALIVIGLTPIELDWAYMEPLSDFRQDAMESSPYQPRRRDI